MSLPSRASLDDWSGEIAEDAVTEMKGEISVIDPNTETSTDYDPEGDSGASSTPTTLLDHRRARIQQYRTPSDDSGAGQWNTKTHIRVQVDLLDTDPVIPSGMIVVVHNGGKNKWLEQYTFEVQRSVNSSSAALRTIDAISELGVSA